MQNQDLQRVNEHIIKRFMDGISGSDILSDKESTWEKKGTRSHMEMRSGKIEKTLGIMHIILAILISIAQFFFNLERWFLDFGLVTPYFLFVVGLVCFILPSNKWYREEILPRLERDMLLTPSEKERYLRFGMVLNLTVVLFGWGWGLLCQTGWTSLLYVAMAFPGPFNIVGKIIAELAFLGIFVVYPGGFFLAFSPLENALMEHLFEDVRPIHEKAKAIDL
jgi:hypothetical protein